VINVNRTAAEPFRDEHIELVQTFADQAAVAIANARLIDAVERQRTELARFVSPQVAELLSSDDGERLLAGHRAYISSTRSTFSGASEASISGSAWGSPPGTRPSAESASTGATTTAR
jgi:hypothetical protein